ncbi:MAG: stage V sporulation protein K, partial [Clostridium sp.]|nr:stage V sporulation protein K [Clostridium sp.]
MEYTNLFDDIQFVRFKKEIEKYNNFQYYNQSAAILKNSINCFPNHPGLYYLLALTYFHCKEYFKAAENFRKGISLNAEKNEYLGLISSCFYMMNDLENSYNYACKAYEIDNRDIDAVITLGRIELLRNNYEESLSYAVIAVEIDNDSFSAVRLLSKIYITMGVDDKDTLHLLYRVRELGIDEDLTLDIIKILYLIEDYAECLKECKSTIANHETGYVIEKATRVVKEIYNKFIVSGQSTCDEAAITADESYQDTDDFFSQKIIETSNKHNDIIKKNTNNDLKNPTLDNIDKIIKNIESNSTADKENSIDYENEKNIVKNEINNAITNNDSNKSIQDKRKSREDNKNENVIERKTASLEEAINKLNDMTGLERVKKEVNKIVKYIKYEKNRKEVLGIDK